MVENGGVRIIISKLLYQSCSATHEVSGRLNEYLASVDEQAEDMFSRLVKEYADKQGVTEQLKAENQLEWVGKMNNIRSRAVEIIDVELICV